MAGTRDVSFALAPGYTTGLVGPNGAGKTTLVRLVLDLARPDPGTIRLFGRDSRREGARLRARVGFVHDRPACYDHLTVERLGGLVSPFSPTWDEELFQATVRDFELPPRRSASWHDGLARRAGDRRRAWRRSSASCGW